VSSFPDFFPANQEELDSKSLNLYNQNGKKISAIAHGFCWNEGLILKEWLNNGVSLKSEKRDAWWVVKDGGCKVSFDQNYLMKLPFGTVLESKNVLEVYHWLVEQHSPAGKRWTKHSVAKYGSVTFIQEEMTPQNLEELIELILIKDGRTVVLDYSFDKDELKKFDQHEIPVEERKLYGVLVPHPAGGDLLIYMWYSDWDDSWRASTKRPKLKSKTGNAIVSSKLFERLHKTMCEVSQIARELPYIYGLTTSICVGGRDFPRKFHELVMALKFLKDHKGWVQNFRRLRKSIKDLLASVENRMSIRRKIKEEEKFLCKLVGVKLKPLKEQTRIGYMTEFKAEFVSEPA